MLLAEAKELTATRPRGPFRDFLSILESWA